MVRTPSTMLPLGTPAPDFALPNVDGRTISFADAAGARGTVVMFICNHCPFVKHVADELARLGRDYAGQGIGLVAISSNDVASHPADSPEQMVREAEDRGYPFPYLYDETQEVYEAIQRENLRAARLEPGDTQDIGKFANRGPGRSGDAPRPR